MDFTPTDYGIRSPCHISSFVAMKRLADPLDIFYDLEGRGYDFVDPALTWNMVAYSADEEIRTPTDSPPNSPSITPLLSTSNTSNSFDEDILIDDSDSRGTGLVGEILMGGTPTPDSYPLVQEPMSHVNSSPEDSPYSTYVNSSVPSAFHVDLEESLPYTTAATNIFIRALTIPIPNDDALELEFREPLYRNIASPDNYMESPADEHLPRYFIKKYGTDTGTLGFPDIYGHMYAQSWTNPVLRHACLAVASFWAGRRAGHTFTHRSTTHINFLLPELQRVIRSRSFDDGHVYAVFMLMSFALDTYRFGVMQKHGEGLVLMLRHLGYLQSTRNGRHVISNTAPPLVIHVWRLALRNDNMCGFGGPRYYKLCLPTMEMNEEPYQRCMDTFLDQKYSHLKEIKRELLLKDLLTHRILHFQNQVSAFRATGPYKRMPDTFEDHITRQGKAVLDEITTQRQNISHQYLRATTTAQVRQFLDRPPFYTSVWESFSLFIYNSQTYIHATLIIDPKLGRSEKYPERTTAAIDLCRAVAAREKFLTPTTASLCFAGLAFIGSHPQELAWVEYQLDKLVRHGRPDPGLYLDVLLYLKQNPTVPWQVAWLEIMSSRPV